MPRGWLLDTNVVSELRKKSRIDDGVVAWAQATPPAICFLSRVSVAEIRVGIEPVGDAAFGAELTNWLENGVRAWFGPRILDVDEEILVCWRRLAELGQKAQYTYSQPDALIAANARVHDLGVVTRNVADFTRAEVAVINPWSS